MIQLFHGNILYSTDKDTIQSLPGGWLAEEDGRVAGVFPQLPPEYRDCPRAELGDKLLIPAFSDMHVHASQFLERGVGLDMELMDWLDRFTFPNEARFADPGYAREVYGLFVEELVRQGTLHVNAFTTVHPEASHILFELLEARGIKAMVGKVNQDMNSPESLLETTAASVRSTEEFLAAHQGGRTVRAAIVPRFTITCSGPLLQQLGALAERYGAPVHSHMCEAVHEVEVVRGLFPQYPNGAEIFRQNGLLGQTQTVMAHCILMNEEVERLMMDPGCMAVHCPDATINVNAGEIMPAKRLLGMGMQVGLGSDVGAGTTLGIYRAAAGAVKASKCRAMYHPEYPALTFQEAFYMGTLCSGRQFGRTGSFLPGDAFDALVIDDSAIPSFEMTPLERLERFCYVGDDRHIAERYLDGRKLEG